MHNKDFRKELKPNQKVLRVVGRICPRCEDILIALPPDRVWCRSTKCNYGEMHIVGKGVMEQELEELEEATFRPEKIKIITEKIKETKKRCK